MKVVGCLVAGDSAWWWVAERNRGGIGDKIEQGSKNS